MSRPRRRRWLTRTLTVVGVVVSVVFVWSRRRPVPLAVGDDWDEMAPEAIAPERATRIILAEAGDLPEPHEAGDSGEAAPPLPRGEYRPITRLDPPVDVTR